MLENRLEEQLRHAQSSDASPQGNASVHTAIGRCWPAIMPLCTLGFALCTLLTVTPLMRVPDSVLRLQIASGESLARVSSWLPISRGAQSAYSDFFLLLSLASLCYGFAALLIRRQTPISTQLLARICLWTGALLAGTIYVVTPAMLSHDILVYASYSRIMAIYHANPYFTPIVAFPHDPFTSLNYWRATVSAYGPIWMLVCDFWGRLLGPDPISYVLVFRITALSMHLLNIWLIGHTLHMLGRSPRTVTLGMLLYAWNPLVLLESSLGGHNDVLMLTFVLFGILLAVRAEKRGQFLRAWEGYLPSVAALTLAALVKYTALPILAAYLLLLICKQLFPPSECPHTLKQALRNWQPALFALFWSVLVAILIVLAFYGLFWRGHSLHDIIQSFKKPASAIGAENSFMRSTIEWLRQNPMVKPDGFLMLLVNRSFWDNLNYIAIAICLTLSAIRLWFKPTSKTFVTSALATMCVVLLITPWFFSWYITWIIGLAVVCLSTHQSRTESALLALTLTFSFSALLIYPFSGGIFNPQYYLVSLFTTLPPICVFLLTLILWRSVSYPRTGEAEQ